MNRRGFLLRTAAFLGATGLVVLGFAGQAARWTARTVSIPFKPFDRSNLEEPNDLAG